MVAAAHIVGRVGGLAAALGIGAALAVAGATVAQASPSESSTSGSSSARSAGSAATAGTGSTKRTTAPHSFKKPVSSPARIAGSGAPPRLLAASTPKLPGRATVMVPALASLLGAVPPGRSVEPAIGTAGRAPRAAASAAPTVEATAPAPNPIFVGSIALSGLLTLAVSPDNNTLYAVPGNLTAVGPNTSISVIDSRTYKVKSTISPGFAVTKIAVGPSGLIYAVGTKGAGTQWDPATGVIGIIDAQSGKTIGSYVNINPSLVSVAVTPNEKSIVVGCSDGTFAVLDATRRGVMAPQLDGTLPGLIMDTTLATIPGEVAISPDSRTAWVVPVVMVAGSKTPVGTTMARVDLVTGATSYLTTTGGARFGGSVVASPDGSKVYVTLSDAGTYAASVGVISVATGGWEAKTYVSAYPASDAALSPDGAYVYVSSTTALYTIDARTLQPISTLDATVSSQFQGYGRDLAVSPDGKRIYLAGQWANVAVVDAYPSFTVTVGIPKASNGVVTGSVTWGNPGDKTLKYTVSTTTKGKVKITSTGSFTFTPSAAARHAASSITATATDKTATFTVTITNGVGAKVSVPVTVTISPKNSAPSGVKASVKSPVAITGVVTGTIKASDADKDTLTYTATTPTKGTVVFGEKGTFTYTPSVTARLAAEAPGAISLDKTDTFTVTVKDAHGGSTSVLVKVAVSPLGGPSSAAGLLLKLPSQSDTIYAEKIKGKDGKYRMVVYMSGMTQTVESTADAVFSNGGLLRRDVQDYIDKAYVAFGKPKEIQLVGYSNGGQQMQNYAAAGTYKANVTSVVLFAAPLIKTTTDFGSDAIAFIDTNDPVPNRFSHSDSMWNTDTKGIYWYTSNSSCPNCLDYAYHAAPSYGTIAAQFDTQAQLPLAPAVYRKMAANILRFAGTRVSTRPALQVIFM